MPAKYFFYLQSILAIFYTFTGSPFTCHCSELETSISELDEFITVERETNFVIRAHGASVLSSEVIILCKLRTCLENEVYMKRIFWGIFLNVFFSGGILSSLPF